MEPLYIGCHLQLNSALKTFQQINPLNRTVGRRQPGSGVNSLMKSVESLYSAYLLEQKSPRRPTSYYQQLQDLDLMAAWSAVREPVLAMHGEYDWIMSDGDFRLLAEIVNRNSPGAAESIELVHTGHTFGHYDSLHSAFAGETGPFDESIAQRVSDWFRRHR